MVNKNYNSGRQFEYRVKKYLEKLGYYVVRSAGSKGQIDIVAIPTEDEITLLPEVLLIQCKHGAKIGKKEREDLLKLDLNLLDGTTCLVAWAKPNAKITFFAWRWCTNKSKWGEVKIE